MPRSGKRGERGVQNHILRKENIEQRVAPGERRNQTRDGHGAKK
jgi:hypothetical protein